MLAPKRIRGGNTARLCLSLTTAFLLMSGVTFAEMAPAERGELVVFTQPDTKFGQTFAKKHWPKLEKLAAELELPIREIDVRDGAPAEVGITPLIVFQNFRGRSIYQGRFTDLGRVENFIRTSRFSPQADVAYEREGLPLRQWERAQLATPLKILDPNGSPPADYDGDEFRDRAGRAVAEGLAEFEWAESISLGRSDRLFYLDFYPWVSEEGELHVSTALFSQFHCKSPLYESKTTTVGPYAELEDVFRRAAAELDAEMTKQLARDKKGDGFDAIPVAVKTVSWSDLGLTLPEAPAEVAVDVSGLTLTDEWAFTTTAETEGRPAIRFRFPAPIDHYRGTVPGATGELTLGPDQTFAELSGWVEADVATLTMGASDINKEIRGETFLNAIQWPKARFDFSSIETDARGPQFGEQIQATISGTLSMRGVEQPISFTAQIEPVVGSNREVQLLVEGRFELNLKTPYGMPAADGPSPQNETVLVDVALSFSPRKSS